MKQFENFLFVVLKSLLSLFLTDKLEILVAGVKQDISNLSTTGTLIPGAYITLIRDINDTITALFPSGISVTFASVSKTLAIAFDGPDLFKNRTRGLLGTWNDDPSDDFTTPDGTVLPGDASPQQIHYDFGLKCEILYFLRHYQCTQCDELS